MNLDKIVERYVKLRDRKTQMDAAHKAAVAEIANAMERLENAFKTTLDKMGVEAVRTEHGTVFKSISTSVTVADKVAFKEYLQETGNWELADIRAGKAAIEHFRQENDDLPPGINWRQAITIGVRRA